MARAEISNGGVGVKDAEQLKLFPDAFTGDKGDCCRVEAWQPTKFDIGSVQFAAYGDRMLVIEDEFRSGYECRACGGRGKRACGQCAGSGSYLRGERSFKCAECEGEGIVACNECGGKGALLIVPDTAQRRPSTGRVVSIGNDVRYFGVGDNVLYSNFAGHAMDIPMGERTMVLRILHEKEILAQVWGHLEISRVRNEREALGI